VIAPGLGDDPSGLASTSGSKAEPCPGTVRHSDMTKLWPTVLAGLAVLLSVAGCSPSTARPPILTPSVRSVVEVTGFASMRLPDESPSGPVTVRVAGIRASRLALLVSQLPSVARVMCHEPLGLIYRMVFGAGSVAQSKTVVEGYRCDAGVTVTVAGKTSFWRRDATCGLIRAVRLVLPGRASATQGLGIGCGR
jgi:hypothetical protein